MPDLSTHQLIDHFFRSEAAKLVAHLTSRFGSQLLTEAEDAVQEALMKAMKAWSYGQVPDNPSGWIYRVAFNMMIDSLRKKQKVSYATQFPESGYEVPEVSEELFQDNQISMIFACCNPKLSQEYQLILTLKILGGLSIKEIATALMKKEATVAKAYTRAKQRFQQENLPIKIPSEASIGNRLNMVLQTIYLLFNEGYKSTEGSQVIRQDLCFEAMRLNQLLLEKKETNNEWTRALMSLMHFHVSRFDARVGESGRIIPLKDQDRGKWDQLHIALGNRYLTTIKHGQQNAYFLQAAISGIHAAAPSYEQTQWPHILTLYDQLYQLKPHAIILLNRLIPLSHVKGPETALEELIKLKKGQQLQDHYLLHATEAELLTQLGQKQQAKQSFEKAIKLSENKQEQVFFQEKIADLSN